MIDRGIALIHEDLERADSLSNIVYYHAIALQKDSLIAKTHALMGYVAYYRGNYAMSSVYYKKALESAYYQDKLERRQALLNNLGVNYEFQHQYADADQAYLKSLEIARRLGDSLSIHESYINLGLLSALLARYETSKGYLKPALSYFQRTNDPRNTALCLRNFANLSLLEENEEDCMRYYNLALQEIRKIGTEVDALETEVDFNWALLKFKRYPLLKSRQERIRPLIEKAGISSGITGTYHLIQGYYYLETRSGYSEAEASFDKAYQIFLEQKSMRQLATVQEGRLSLYAQTGNIAKHRSLLADYTRILEENFLAINADQVGSLNNIHKLELQKLEIEQLTSKLASDRVIKILLFVLLGVILVAFVIFARGYRLINRQKRRIHEKNIELTELVKLLKNGRTVSSANNGDPLPDPSDNAAADIAGQTSLDLKLDAFDKEYDRQVLEKVEQLITQKQLYLKPDLKIGDVADALQLNEKEISKAINDIRDQRFTTYINYYRIDLAKELLITYPQDTIKEITFKTGFSSQPQFQRKFKELTGLTPEQFRMASSYQDART
jgi:AraC-like DNA-binding protein